MKKKLKPIAVGLGLIALALGVLVLDILRFTGTFRRFDTGFAGTCAGVNLGGSSEDIRLDRERGIAYLSVLDRAALVRGEAVGGTVMLLDLNLVEPVPRAAMAHDPPGFRPHGLSLWRHPGEALRLFAISHRADGAEVVEIAAQDPGGAFVPVETVKDASFTHPNAIAAAGSRQFYLVNDSGSEARRTRAFEALFRRPSSTLVYYDGTKSRVLDATLKFPAGLALSPDGAHLYVGEALAKQLRVYRRDPANGGIELEESVPLNSAPDNVDVDADGVVWIAAHPKLLAFFAQLRDPRRRAPTQVLRFDPRGPRSPGAADARLSQVYGDDGAQISAGSVAARWHNEMLIGAIFDPKVLICRLSP